MTHRLVCVVLAVILGALGPAALGRRVQAPAAGPNVIVVMTDDMRVDDLQFMPYTVRLLADQGATFSQMVSPYPLCCPARAELLSGQYSHNNGVQGNALPRGGYYRLDNDNTLPVWLQNQGYETAFMGKYLNQYGMRDQSEVPPGWDFWNGALRHIYRYLNVTLNENGQPHTYRHIYQTDLYDHRARQLVNLYRRSDRPYFMWVSNVAPHQTCTRDVANDYDHNRSCWKPPPPMRADRGTFTWLALPHNPSINEEDMSDKGAFMRRLRLLTPRQLAVLRQDRIQRVEALQSVDRQVKHLVGDLKRTGEYDNTYIIFASDNGIQLGEHRWRTKVLGYEQSVRVPLIITGPGIPAGVVRQQEVTTVDLAATIADMTNTSPGRRLDGQSLLPLATGRVPDTGDRIVPLEAAPMSKHPVGWLYEGARTNRYTLLRWKNGDLELYDRSKDRFEVNSVAGVPAYADVQRRLLHALIRLHGCAGRGCMEWLGHVPGRE